MKILGYTTWGLLAVLLVGCGAADGTEAEAVFGAEEGGEVTQALSTWSVSFQQGKPAELCGPSAQCTTLAASYSGTQDATVRLEEPNRNFGPETKLDMASVSSSSVAVALIKWDIFALNAALPANAKLASARVTFKVTKTSTASYEVNQVVQPWDEMSVTWDRWRWLDHVRLEDRLGVLEPRTTGGAGAARAPIVTVELDVRRLGPIFQAWLADPSKNHGLWVGHPGSVAPLASVYSSEGATPPKLTLSFTTP